jgi:hypothetical protein
MNVEEPSLFSAFNCCTLMRTTQIKCNIFIGCGTSNSNRDTFDGSIFKDYIVATPPTQPSTLVVAKTSATVIRARWKPTSTVERYTVIIKPQTGKSVVIETKSPSTPLKLVPGKRYTITVTAIGFGDLKSKVLKKTFVAPRR